MRAIDADVLKRHIDKLPALPDGNFAGNHSALKALINMQPTIEPSTNNSEIPNSYDTISRQAVIDALHTCFSDGFDGDKWWNSTHVLAAIEGLPPAQPEQQHGRIFREIVVKYPSYCTYPEYKGKPYFSIKYTENGQEFIGYGTYKPEVLSKYLKEYFMPPAQPERIKGHWIDAVIPNDNGGLPVQVCDQCNAFFPLAYTGGGHSFCPNCGADMKGES